MRSGRVAISFFEDDGPLYISTPSDGAHSYDYSFLVNSDMYNLSHITDTHASGSGRLRVLGYGSDIETCLRDGITYLMGPV